MHVVCVYQQACISHLLALASSLLLLVDQETELGTTRQLGNWKHKLQVLVPNGVFRVGPLLCTHHRAQGLVTIVQRCPHIHLQYKTMTITCIHDSSSTCTVTKRRLNDYVQT